MTAEVMAANALVKAGFPLGAIDDGLKLLDIDEFDNEHSIADKVQAVRERIPGMFETRPAPGPLRPAAARVTSGGESEYDAGARMARERAGRHFGIGTPRKPPVIGSGPPTGRASRFAPPGQRPPPAAA